MKSNCYSLIYSSLALALYFCPLVLGHPVFDNLEFIIIATWSCKMNDVKWIGSSTLSLNPQMGKWELDMQNIFVGKNGCIINMNTMFLHHRRVCIFSRAICFYVCRSKCGTKAVSDRCQNASMCFLHFMISSPTCVAQPK